MGAIDAGLCIRGPLPGTSGAPYAPDFPPRNRLQTTSQLCGSLPRSHGNFASSEGNESDFHEKNYSRFHPVGITPFGIK